MATVRRQARKLLSLVPVPSPWSIDEFCREVGTLRGRPVVITAVSSGVATASVRREPTQDVIAYRADHHNPDHVIAHELGHLLAGDLDGPPNVSGSVDGDLASAARMMLRDCNDGSDRERVAECFAGLVMERARRYTAGTDASTTAARTLRGYGEAMR